MLGVALRKTRRMPEGSPAVLNSYVINIALPALTLYYVHRMDIVPNVAYSVAAPWLMFAIGAVLFHFVGKALGWKRETVGGIILVGSLANTSFVGLPMIESFYGAEYMGLGIIIDQLGTYLVLSTLGILLAAVYSVGRVSIASVSRRVLGFPPLLALILALGLQPITFPETLELVLERLGSTLAPVALISVGYQLRLDQVAGRVMPLAVGLTFQLVIGPLIVMGCLFGVVGFSGISAQVTVFELAMAPQIGAAIVAMDYKLDAPLATLMVGLGIPLSFLTLPMWWVALKDVYPPFAYVVL